MNMNAIETRELPVEITPERGDGLDETAVDILQTVYIAAKILEEINAAVAVGTIDSANPPVPLTRAYVDALVDAIDCFQTLKARDDYEAFLEDVSTLDREMLAEVRGTIVYVGSHFGIEIDLPSPTEGEGGVDA